MLTKWIKKNHLLLINFSSTFIFLLIFIIYPYLKYNDVIQWDSVGHLYSAWYIKEYLFPAPIGWNPNFFLGFPQGTFYPPLFHYTTAILSFILPIKLAFKILVSFAVMLTPISFYYFAKNFSFSRNSASTIMVGMTSILIAPIMFSSVNNNIGGNFISTFNTGLVTNALALPLYFFYLASLKKNISKGKYIAPSIILTLIIHTHIITALMSVLSFVIFVIFYVKQKKDIYFIIKHTALVSLLCAWWIVPFFVFIPYSETIKVPLMLGGGSFALIFLGMFFSMIIMMKKTKVNIMLISLFLFITISTLLLNFLNIKLHTYRFIIFALLLVPLFFVQIIPKKYHILNSIIFIIIIIWGIKTNLVQTKGPQINNKTEIGSYISGRSLILADGIANTSPHYFQHSIPQENNIAGVKGLFVESSINSKYLMELEKMIDPQAFVWGVGVFNYQNFSNNKIKELSKNHLNNFGIQNVISHKRYQALSDYSYDNLFSYDKPGLVWSFDNQKYEIPVWLKGSYFVNTDDYLFYVLHKPTEIVFDAYAPLSTTSDSMILESSEDTFYINQYDDKFFSVDFYLNESAPIVGDVKALKNLKENLNKIELKNKDRDLIKENLSLLEDELYETDLQYAKMKYAADQNINIEKIWTSTLRIDETKTKEQNQTINFIKYNIPENNIIEVLDYIPENINQNWDQVIQNWFTSSESDKILINKQTPLTDKSPDSAEIQDIKLSKKLDNIKFNVNAKKSVPILIKSSYFPKWRAKANGVEIPIYKASPNMMLVYGKGNIELYYATQWYEYLAVLSSVLSVIYLFYITILKKIFVGNKKK